MVLTIPLPRQAVYPQRCLCANIWPLRIRGANQPKPRYRPTFLRILSAFQAERSRPFPTGANCPFSGRKSDPIPISCSFFSIRRVRVGNGLDHSASQAGRLPATVSLCKHLASAHTRRKSAEAAIQTNLPPDSQCLPGGTVKTVPYGGKLPFFWQEIGPNTDFLLVFFDTQSARREWS